ncbi:class I SAM-dependent methyltransferase [Rubinisphaera italica]|uniref:Class I SAM-dependent methyltransferase n=1 Tax=Rubinisphaera italica TaxID=2527969 RepID=A0A5C5XKV1_9PLAN|nr:class I SAM-dependent methyltransferase [Rubinisphaera italica]TWT63169.1 hypothetical protein Pan54_39220 [Rubinisphaera italica]
MNLNALVERAKFYPGYCFPREVEWLAATAGQQRQDARWCEVGTLFGKSLIVVGHSLPRPATLVSVDLNWGRQEAAGISAHTAFRELSNGHGLQLHAIRSASVQAAETFPNEWFDVVYIDAAHDYESVRADIDAWLPKIRTGGMICGHDFNDALFPGLIKAVDETPLETTNPAGSIWMAHV